MTAVHVVVSVLALAGCAAAAAWGGWCWWRGEIRGFWPLLRAAQAAVVAQAAVGGVLLLAGRHDPQSLHALYGALPIVVMFFAEQLRITAADHVLGQRDLEDAQAVGRLPEAEQHAVVRAIVQRELAVMALAALVALALLLRAWQTAG